ncbi:MAG: cobyrinate a,c-diamide synthase [Rhodopseudomonas sp.]|uniref:cobyrinate a,c-diamide synthase n=1 Tax=Rhodopseudomonas sp. TaxID=1078 RepID=UPI0017E6B7CB|nr:cobyrinate a,c-diamide synthase [Rhodopseudomonas sp.]NVN85978.1 cobyrinate a,c-diamide synthase [Rhodopseudomonas sp.]
MNPVHHQLAARGLMIAAPRSGSGKTTLTLGLLRALHRNGLRVSGAKCGPDYIDPAFHQAASGRPSLNLDSWSMSPGLLAGLAAQAAQDCDLVICEAVMGLFDGASGQPGRTGSSADVAGALDLPVVLVLDVGAQAQSAGAVVKGFMSFDPRIRIAGVVLNRIGSPRHLQLVSDGIAPLGIPILGSLPASSRIALPERHLGLVQAGETSDLDHRLDAMADLVAEHIRLDQLIALAGPMQAPVDAPAVALRPPGQRIALAHDAAFSFVYPHLLAGWRASGAEIVAFSPLANQAPAPDCDVCWLPGGYPELHAGQLAAAGDFLDGLRRFAADKPVHGECGGYMTLGETLTDAGGAVHRMAGLLGVHTSFAQRKLHLGYREALLVADGCLGAAGAILRGHEFHYASVTAPGADEPFAFVTDAYSSDPAPSGSRRGRVTGSFFHMVATA